MENYYYHLRGSNESSEFEKSRLKARDVLTSRFNKKFAGLNSLERAIVQESNKEVLGYISEHLNLKVSYRTIILTTSTSSYIDDVDFDNVRAIINLESANQTKNSDKLFKAVNTLLPDAGIYIGLFSTFSHAEALGESLNRYGFEIVDLQTIKDSSYFVAIKTKESAWQAFD